MSINSKLVLAAAFSIGTAFAGVAAGAKPIHHHPATVRDNAWGSYALAPSATPNGAIAAPRARPGCTNAYYYDRALDGYSYDLVCNGVDLSPHL